MDDGRELRIQIPYQPRQQFKPFHNRTERWAAIVAHRRAGKTVACINDLIRDALLCPKDRPHTGYIAPTYAQAKAVVWDYLKFYGQAIPGSKPNETELRLDLPNGGQVRLFGADNYDRMRGLYFDAVVLDEYADMSLAVWPLVVRPALSDRQGRATFIGTPKGKNDFWRIWAGDPETGRIGAVDSPDWYSVMLKASETGILPESELLDARKTMSADEYAQEYECSFDAAIKGAYYAEEIRLAEQQKRITSVPYDKYLKVITAWDLGYTDSTAIWFLQIAGQEIHVIDYYEANGQNLAHYGELLRSKPYAYGEHYFPHDVQAHMLGMDRSRMDTLRALGIEPTVVQAHAVDDGINAVRRIFDRLWIDAGRCSTGLEALRQYRRDYDDKTKMFKPKPRHDWSSHGADALRCFAAGWPETSVSKQPIDRHRRALYGREREKSWLTA